MDEVIIKPPRLSPGNTIGLVAPASNVEEDEQIRYAGEVIESIGFRLKFGRHVFERRGYCAGSDQDRAADINGMFADPDIRAIIALRGGFGSLRILPFLDYDLIRSHPKILLGYSDITALINTIHSKTGLITFHGPNAIDSLSEYGLKELLKVLAEPRSDISIACPPIANYSPGRVEYRNRITRICGGVATGRTVGGNLSSIVRLLGTPYAPSFQSKILILEEVGEKAYRIDAMLTQLALAGALRSLSGIVLGKFLAEAMRPETELKLEKFFRETFDPLGIPVVRGLMIGHISDQATVPIGVKARLISQTGELRLEESAVT